MDILIFKLAILLIPGFVALHMIKTFSGIPLSERRTLSTYDFLLILLFSIMSAAIFDFGIKWISKDWQFSMFEWITKFNGDSTNLFTVDVFLILCVINIILGLVFAICDTYHLFYNVLSFFKISNQFGREDIWSYYTSIIAKEEWVVVRDFANKCLYRGRIHMTSETFEKREVILQEAKVYRLSDVSIPIFESAYMYLPLEDGNYTIEILPAKPEKKEEKENGKR